MRIAILSDVHANLEALETALRTIDERGADALYCLGDTVGYGGDPGACVDIIRERCDGVVLGNHDVAVATGEGLDALPRDGRDAALLHAELLSDEQRAWLGGLPPRLEAHGCTFVHATPDEPTAWRRLDSYQVVKAQFDHFDTPICFAGHAHVPALLSDRLGVLKVRPGARFFVNVGSVGQPRDGNPRLCVAFFDTEAFAYELVRIPYRVEAAAASIREAGLPENLARRLMVGR